MRNAKTLLFIYDEQTQIMVGDLLAQQFMRADHDIDLPVQQIPFNFFLFFGVGKNGCIRQF